jgi:uroporphyrin-III C-methyltransferase
MSLLPVFLKLAGRRCLLVGAGNVALGKIGSLLNTGLDLTVVAPQALPAIRQLAAEGKLRLLERAFAPSDLSDLDGCFLAIAATDSNEVNSAVYRAAGERNIPCNSVDDIPNCDFFFGSVVSRGDLQVAISTSGKSPSFAQRLRREIDEQLPQELGLWLEQVGEVRREVLSTHSDPEERKLLLHQLAQMPVCDSSDCPARRLAATPEPQMFEQDDENTVYGLSGFSEPLDLSEPLELNALQPETETVYLVGAGPGDPDLLTLKAHRLIQTADVILHDDLVPQAILDPASPSALVVNVGKRCGVKTISQDEINAMMIEHACAGRSVVRLKGGDPLLFGRAAEELAVLAKAGVPAKIVPGISAGFAAAAAVGCSLTDRGTASSVSFSTGHHAAPHDRGTPPLDPHSTRIVYMPGRDLAPLAAEWLAHGLPPELPCAIVSQAAQPGQSVQVTTLAKLGSTEPVVAPSLVIAGWTVGKTPRAPDAPQ